MLLDCNSPTTAQPLAQQGAGDAMRKRGRKPNGPDLEEAKKAYLAACRLAGNVRTWLYTQETYIDRFIAFHEDHLQAMSRAEPYHLTAYLAHCQKERGNSSATLHRLGTVLRAWARWCRKSRLVPMCAMADAEIPKERPNVVLVAPLDVYLNALDAHPHRWGNVFRVLLSSGLRRGELLHLRWEDIDLTANVISVKRRAEWSPKSRKDRLVGLTEDGQLALKRLIADRKKPGMLGPFLNEHARLTISPTTLTHGWLEFTRAANLPPRLHSTRHAHATAAVEAGALLTDVQAQLGHAAITTTMRYVKPNPAAPLRVIAAIERRSQTPVQPLETAPVDPQA